MKRNYFVAGTDTGVGKTLVTSAMLHSASQMKLQTLGLKPVAAGCDESEHGLANEDALSLMAFSSVQIPYQQVNPVALTEAIAPHIAAVNDGKRLQAERIAGHCRGAMMQAYDLCLLEGAGGWRVPLNARETMADIVKALQVPVVLVVGIRLGCLNHALLTAEAITRDGLKLAGWVANVVEDGMPELEANVGTLQSLLPCPQLGLIPFRKGISAPEASEYLDIKNLLESA
ncbi:MAG: dethiobiotin synthase [Agarilytica sp.]